MDLKPCINSVSLCGAVIGPPIYSHSVRGQAFYRVTLEALRLSGTPDQINLLVHKDQLAAIEVSDATKLRVLGELRSYNNRSGEGARLVISVLVKEMSFCEDEDENQVELEGCLCKAPVLRRTPLGREICDLILAVNRRYGRSDYLPVICWGTQARRAASWDVGTRLHLLGRLQSRAYMKQTEEGLMTRTAFEISASSLTLINSEAYVL